MKYSLSNKALSTSLVLAAAAAVLPAQLSADVRLPALFGDHMVLQRGQENPVWGWASPGEDVEVRIADQIHTVTAGDNGRWQVTVDELPVGGPYEMTIAGNNSLTLGDILVGEVWICSGQSNMQWPVSASDDGDLEALAAHHPQLRLISVPQVASQKPLNDFEGEWSKCSPQTVGNFSAVGYYFGRQLHETLQVPIGLIDNAWGGSACEAWVRRELLEQDDRYQPLLKKWQQIESQPENNQVINEFEAAVEEWEAGGREGPRPRTPGGQLYGNQRPANLFNGVLHPIMGYGIRGVVWYQGESNAGRAYQYRHLFPLMIQNWRDEWNQGDFPFYWVQLADYMQESQQPHQSAWAELREAQTMTLAKLPNTGQAVITDLGEASDIHPRNKLSVARRLARWALAKDYGFDVVHRSPQYKAMQVEGSKIALTFDIGTHKDGALDTFDVKEPIGFAIAGEDRNFVWANASIVGKDKIEVFSAEVPEPVAVRYAWADNPVCNLQNRVGLPATPFRTDDWPGVTADNHQ